MLKIVWPSFSLSARLLLLYFYEPLEVVYLRLQMVQNAAVRLLNRFSIIIHITLILSSSRDGFKVQVLTYGTLCRQHLWLS